MPSVTSWLAVLSFIAAAVLSGIDAVRTGSLASWAIACVAFGLLMALDVPPGLRRPPAP